MLTVTEHTAADTTDHDTGRGFSIEGYSTAKF